MVAPHPVDVFRELVRRGLIAAEPAPQPLARGNLDRKNTVARSSWRVDLPAGGQAKLTLDCDLGDLATRHAAFARAVPALATRQVFHVRLPQAEVLAETYFQGASLEAAVRDRLLPAEALGRSFTEVCRALVRTEQPSTETARTAEWQAWAGRLLQSPTFNTAERRLLGETVLPGLYAQLGVPPPATRWSNGDFISGNILLDATGTARLIDTEFARLTHFFPEDAARFHALSPAARHQRALFTSLLPDPGPAWHLYFWLRQLQLEADGNSADYLARVQPVRLAAIRRLAEYLLGGSLAGWSVAATELHATVETARWVQTAGHDLHLAGWCRIPATPIRAVVATAGDRSLVEIAPVARADVQQHFSGDALALLSGFSLAVTLPQPDATVILSALTDEGTLLPFHGLRAGDLPGRGPAFGDYAAWAARHDPDPPAPPAPPVRGPLFSILLPVYRTPPPFLRACLASVRAQHYPHWELVIVDDASGSVELTALLHEAATDPRVRLRPRAANGGIACATNDALAAAAGDFIVLLDHDDLLRPHALAELAAALQRDPALDAVYSDEDKITAGGGRVVPFLKPDFSPEFLLGVMHAGHVLCVRAAVARAAGGFDSAFDGVQDYEFLLRVTEHTRCIGHVPRILYHWRQSPGSSALHGNVKGDMNQKQADAVRAHLKRRGDSRQVTKLGEHRLRLQPANPPSLEMVRCPDGGDPLAALRTAAARSTAEVLVLSDSTVPAGNDWSAELAALAARPDSGLVAPLLLSREGRVLESGWTFGPAGAVPLMRGFDAGGDGCNGSLVCTREVAAVSPVCVALRRALANEAGANWLEFSEQLRARGLFHRVCPAARVTVAASWRDPASLPGRGAAADPFFNPHFDATRGDYSLAAAPGTAQFTWHIDTPPATSLPAGGLAIRGWCFRPDGQPCTLKVAAGEMSWAASSHLPRPDVAAAHAGRTDGACGFSLRLRVPPGRHRLVVEAEGGGDRAVLLQATVTVPDWINLRRWLFAPPAHLLAFQMLAAPCHPPRPLRPEKFPAPSSAPKPKLSIVTPSYNQALFLPETMGSVLGQTVACEYVVQDGGSTDRSADLIRQQAGRLHAWASERDTGQAEAVARGFAKTSGRPEDVMAWINSDDFYLPGALAYVADYFARHPDIDVLYGHRVLVDEQSREIGRWFLPGHDDGILRLNDFVPQETLFWRRRVWDKAGGIDPSFKFALDWDLLLRFQAAGARMVRVPHFLACFRIHPAQKTSAAMHSTGQREIDLLRARAQGREIPPAELENDPRLVRYLRRSAFLEFLWRSGLRAP